MVGQVFLAYQNLPDKPKRWQFFKTRRWKKKKIGLDNRYRILKYR